MSENLVKILLLEDDPEDVEVIRQLLELPDAREAFRVQPAARLSEALALMEQVSFDALLIDLMLPDSEGLETFHRLHAGKPDTPIVILSGMADEALATAAVGQGAQDYLIKGSSDSRGLRRALRYAIERARLTRNLRAVIDKAADAMVIVDRWGTARYVNPATAGLFGRKPEEILGRPFQYHISPNETTEIVLSDSGSGRRVAEVRAVEIEWQGVPSILASIRDVTNLQRLEQLRAEVRERRKMEQLKDQFLHAVSHELRSPLSIIKAVIANFRDGLTGPMNAEQLKQVQMADRNAGRLNKIVANLLELSRLESGRAKMNTQRFDLTGILRDMVECFRLTPEGSRLTIEVNIEKGLPRVEADPDMIVQVFSNLLDNAMRFTKSRIRIEARSLEGEAALRALGRGFDHGLNTPAVEVTISDDGDGIPANRLGELFNKFVQINRPVGGSQYKGTGMGLAICKEIVLRHQGRIWAESPAGARFHVAIPQMLDLKAAPEDAVSPPRRGGA